MVRTRNIPTEEALDQITNRFDTLVQKFGEVVFKGAKWFAWNMPPISEDKTQMSWWYRLIVANAYKGKLLIWSVLSLSQSILLINLFELESDSTSQSWNNSTFEDKFSIISWITIIILLFLVAHIRWYFLFMSGNILKRFAKYLVFFILTAAFTILTCFLIFKLAEPQFITYNLAFRIFLVSTFLVFPALSIIVFSSLFVPSLLMSLLTWIIDFHITPQKEIKQLTLQPIQNTIYDTSQSEAQDTWRLIDLPLKEFELLKHWSQTRRDNIEKRLLPTALFIGVFGVVVDALTGLEPIRLILERFVTWLFNVFFNSLEKDIPFANFIGNQFLGFLIMMPVIFFLASIFNLFKELIIQSIIIEVCVWVDYLRIPSSAEANTLSKSQTKRKNLFQCLFRNSQGR